MRGDGDTLDAANADLREQLRRHRDEQGSLPRPGTGRELDLKLATTEKVDLHRELIADILQRVIGVAPGDCFVSDESTLWDFHEREDNAEYQKKIVELYGVDVSDIEPPTLVAIALRIRNRRLTGD